jgi:hypothetical protein
MKDLTKVVTADCIGPGGIKCWCCAPAPGKARKALRRLARSRIKNADRRNLWRETKEFSK